VFFSNVQVIINLHDHVSYVKYVYFETNLVWLYERYSEFPLTFFIEEGRLKNPYPTKASFTIIRHFLLLRQLPYRSTNMLVCEGSYTACLNAITKVLQGIRFNGKYSTPQNDWPNSCHHSLRTLLLWPFCIWISWVRLSYRMWLVKYEKKTVFFKA
jgi:hypothetical protein